MQIISLESKNDWELFPYTFDWTGMASDADPINAIAFGISKSSDDPHSPTLITAMVYATAYTNTKSTCVVGSGADAEGNYWLRARITLVSGIRFEQKGIFVVKVV